MDPIPYGLATLARDLKADSDLTRMQLGSILAALAIADALLAAIAGMMAWSLWH